MSRVGKQPVVLPQGVTINIEATKVTVTGKKGTLSFDYLPEFVQIKQEENNIIVTPTKAEKARMYQGLTRNMLRNLTEGVSEGYSKILEIHGVGYKAAQKGTGLSLSLGYSHPVEVAAPQGITFVVDQKENTITVQGNDKQLVGQVAANIREYRSPEPYKGKGIRYRGEYILRKAGKSSAK